MYPQHKRWDSSSWLPGTGPVPMGLFVLFFDIQSYQTSQIYLNVRIWNTCGCVHMCSQSNLRIPFDEPLRLALNSHIRIHCNLKHDAIGCVWRSENWRPMTDFHMFLQDIHKYPSKQHSHLWSVLLTTDLFPGNVGVLFHFQESSPNKQSIKTLNITHLA